MEFLKWMETRWKVTEARPPPNSVLIKATETSIIAVEPTVYPEHFRWITFPSLPGYPDLRIVVPWSSPSEATNAPISEVLQKTMKSTTKNDEKRSALIRSPPPPPPPRTAPGGPDSPSKARKKWNEASINDRLKMTRPDDGPKPSIKKDVNFRKQETEFDATRILMSNYLMDSAKREKMHRETLAKFTKPTLKSVAERKARRKFINSKKRRIDGSEIEYEYDSETEIYEENQNTKKDKVQQRYQPDRCAKNDTSQEIRRQNDSPTRRMDGRSEASVHFKRDRNRRIDDDPRHKRNRLISSSPPKSSPTESHKPHTHRRGH